VQDQEDICSAKSAGTTQSWTLGRAGFCSSVASDARMSGFGEPICLSVDSLFVTLYEFSVVLCEQGAASQDLMTLPHYFCLLGERRKLLTRTESVSEKKKLFVDDLKVERGNTCRHCRLHQILSKRAE
jgi:hypothetical protein